MIYSSMSLSMTPGQPARERGYAWHDDHALHEHTEEPLMAQTAQYDHIGSKSDEYVRTATLKRAESYSFFRLVGCCRGSMSWSWPAAVVFTRS